MWCALGVVAQGRWGKASANHPAVEVVPRVILSKGGLLQVAKERGHPNPFLNWKR